MSEKYEKKVTKLDLIFKLIQTRLSNQIQIHNIDHLKYLYNLKIKRGKHKIITNKSLVNSNLTNKTRQKVWFEGCSTAKHLCDVLTSTKVGDFDILRETKKLDFSLCSCRNYNRYL